MKENVDSQQEKRMILLAKYQLRLNYWKKKVAELEKEVEEKLMKSMK